MDDTSTKLRLIVKNRFFRKPIVVLQIRERKPYNYNPVTDIRPGGYRDEWRDARPEDIAVHAHLDNEAADRVRVEGLYD